MKKALITGVNGQDGTYLAEFLLEKGYKVLGIVRRVSNLNYSNIEHLISNDNFKIEYSDLTDGSSINKIIETFLPDEVYNLGAMSHVKLSFEIPEFAASVNGLGTLKLLESIKNLRNKKEIKFYQASTSELYGKVLDVPQSETTPFYPRSPYAISKLYAYWITVNYREAYDIFACNGILFNHESPRRGKDFVTRKIVIGISEILKGNIEFLEMGNLDAQRDWGHAKDYVRGMYLMLQQDNPEDFVLGTGVTNTVRDFIKEAFEVLEIEIEFSGTGIHEIGKVFKCRGNIKLPLGKTVVKINDKFFRPTEVDLLVSNPSKAIKKLNWKLEYNFKSLVKEMMEHELKLSI